MRALRIWSSIALSTLLFAQQAQRNPPSTSSPSAPDPGVSISGKVADSNGGALRKVTVTLRPTLGPLNPGDSPPQPYAATTDAEGKFLFTGVDPGKYTLGADHPGYLHANYAPGNAGNAGFAAVVVTLLTGHDMSEVNFRMARESAITGKIVDEDGDPVTRVQIRLSRPGFQQGRRQLLFLNGASPDENGEFKMTGITPGKYYLSAEPQPTGMAVPRPAIAGQPTETWIGTYYPGVSDSSAATAIDVPPAQTVAGVTIRMLKSTVVHVRGKVSGLGGALPGSRVMLTREGGFPMFGPNGSAALKKDGSFELAGVSPGHYTLNVTNNEGRMELLGVQALDVGKDDVTDIVVAAGKLADLHGAVRIEGPDKAAAPDATGTIPVSAAPVNNAVAPIRLNFSSADSPFAQPSATVQDDGTFTVTGLGAAKYRVNVFGLPSGSYLKSMSMGNRDVLDEGLDLTSGAVESTLEVVVSQAAAQIEGTVMGDDGKPAPGSFVTLIPEPPRPELTFLYFGQSADQNGQFQWKSVRPGRYKIYAWERIQGGEQYDPDFAKGLEDHGIDVTVAENDHQQFTLTRISNAQNEEAKRRYGR